MNKFLSVNPELLASVNHQSGSPKKEFQGTLFGPRNSDDYLINNNLNNKMSSHENLISSEQERVEPQEDLTNKLINNENNNNKLHDQDHEIGSTQWHTNSNELVQQHETDLRPRKSAHHPRGSREHDSRYSFKEGGSLVDMNRLTSLDEPVVKSVHSFHHQSHNKHNRHEKKLINDNANYQITDHHESQLAGYREQNLDKIPSNIVPLRETPETILENKQIIYQTNPNKPQLNSYQYTRTDAATSNDSFLLVICIILMTIIGILISYKWINKKLMTRTRLKIIKRRFRQFLAGDDEVESTHQTNQIGTSSSQEASSAMGNQSRRYGTTTDQAFDPEAIQLVQRSGHNMGSRPDAILVDQTIEPLKEPSATIKINSTNNKFVILKKRVVKSSLVMAAKSSRPRVALMGARVKRFIDDEALELRNRYNEHAASQPDSLYGRFIRRFIKPHQECQSSGDWNENGRTIDNQADPTSETLLKKTGDIDNGEDQMSRSKVAEERSISRPRIGEKISSRLNSSEVVIQANHGNTQEVNHKHFESVNQTESFKTRSIHHPDDAGRGSHSGCSPVQLHDCSHNLQKTNDSTFPNHLRSDVVHDSNLIGSLEPQISCLETSSIGRCVSFTNNANSDGGVVGIGHNSAPVSVTDQTKSHSPNPNVDVNHHYCDEEIPIYNQHNISESHFARHLGSTISTTLPPPQPTVPLPNSRPCYSASPTGLAGNLSILPSLYQTTSLCPYQSSGMSFRFHNNGANYSQQRNQNTHLKRHYENYYEDEHSDPYHSLTASIGMGLADLALNTNQDPRIHNRHQHQNLYPCQPYSTNSINPLENSINDGVSRIDNTNPRPQSTGVQQAKNFLPVDDFLMQAPVYKTPYISSMPITSCTMMAHSVRRDHIGQHDNIATDDQGILFKSCCQNLNVHSDQAEQYGNTVSGETNMHHLGIFPHGQHHHHHLETFSRCATKGSSMADTGSAGELQLSSSGSTSLGGSDSGFIQFAAGATTAGATSGSGASSRAALAVCGCQSHHQSTQQHHPIRLEPAPLVRPKSPGNSSPVPNMTAPMSILVQQPSLASRSPSPAIPSLVNQENDRSGCKTTSTSPLEIRPPSSGRRSGNAPERTSSNTNAENLIDKADCNIQDKVKRTLVLNHSRQHLIRRTSIAGDQISRNLNSDRSSKSLGHEYNSSRAIASMAETRPSFVPYNHNHGHMVHRASIASSAPQSGPHEIQQLYSQSQQHQLNQMQQTQANIQYNAGINFPGPNPISTDHGMKTNQQQPIMTLESGQYNYTSYQNPTMVNNQSFSTGTNHNNNHHHQLHYRFSDAVNPNSTSIPLEDPTLTSIYPMYPAYPLNPKGSNCSSSGGSSSGLGFSGTGSACTNTPTSNNTFMSPSNCQPCFNWMHGDSAPSSATTISSSFNPSQSLQSQLWSQYNTTSNQNAASLHKVPDLTGTMLRALPTLGASRDIQQRYGGVSSTALMAAQHHSPRRSINAPNLQQCINQASQAVRSRKFSLPVQLESQSSLDYLEKGQQFNDSFFNQPDACLAASQGITSQQRLSPLENRRSTLPTEVVEATLSVDQSRQSIQREESRRSSQTITRQSSFWVEDGSLDSIIDSSLDPGAVTKGTPETEVERECRPDQKNVDRRNENSRPEQGKKSPQKDDHQLLAKNDEDEDDDDDDNDDEGDAGNVSRRARIRRLGGPRCSARSVARARLTKLGSSSSSSTRSAGSPSPSPDFSRSRDSVRSKTLKATRANSSTTSRRQQQLKQRALRNSRAHPRLGLLTNCPTRHSDPITPVYSCNNNSDTNTNDILSEDRSVLLEVAKKSTSLDAGTGKKKESPDLLQETSIRDDCVGPLDSTVSQISENSTSQSCEQDSGSIDCEFNSKFINQEKVQ